jgi:amino acid adenylation domain-containing protein
VSAGAEVYVLPVSAAQRRIWFLAALQPASTAYNLSWGFALRGPLRRRALVRSLAEVVRRHETLRTRFAVRDGQPVQVVGLAAAVALPVVDLSALSAAHRTAAAARELDALARRPFDLARGPLWRCLLLELAPDEAVLLHGMHHIVTDGWSEGVFAREISRLYAAFAAGGPSPLPELPLQYGDYAAWQRQELLHGEVLEELLAYWRRQLAGAPAVLDLPTDFPRPALPASRGAIAEIAVPDAVTAALRQLGRGQRCTLFHVLLAAFGVLLERASGQQDLVIGSPVANRDQVELEGLIGLFVDMLPLRLDLAGDPAFAALLPQVRETVHAAHEHKALPFEQLVTELRIERHANRNPLFQVVFNHEIQGDEPPARLGDVTLVALKPAATTAKFDLALGAVERGAQLGAVFEYSTELFSAAIARQLATSLGTLLAEIAADPARPVSALPLLTPAERRELTAGAAVAAATPTAPTACLHELFAAQARRTPDAVAVTCEGARLTYAGLARRAADLARRLRPRLAGGEPLVGIYLERSLELVVAIVAVLEAGAAYLPLDPAYPAERLDFLLRDSGAPVVVTAAPLAERLAAVRGTLVLVDAADDPPPPAAAPAGVGPESPAYVIYTSGSTGAPKGVIVAHSNVVRLFSATREDYGFDAADVWTLFHSCAFDFSVWEIWGALLYGGRLAVVPYWVSRTPEAFRDLLVREQVTVLNQTPTAFHQLARLSPEGGEGPLPGALRWVIFGGEALEPAKLATWFARHGDRAPRLVNMYGITETTVHVTQRPLARADAAAGGSPIGVALADLWAGLLDRHGEPVPRGLRGEICVGGRGVSRGYLGRPELTAERFVPDAFSGVPGARLYRSGDLARQRPDGDLDYLGRADRQVKIRGFRIEPGEIEAALAAQPGVAQAAVVAQPGADGEALLVAYLVPAGGAEGPAAPPELGELRAALAARLPAHMIPARFAFLPALPLTAHGKLDRRALPAVGRERPELDAAWQPPRTPVEEVLCAVWARVLGLDRVGIHDNFFTLGGDSLRTLQVLTAARERGIALTLVQVFQHQTVAALAREVAFSTAGALPARTEPLSLVGEEDRGRLPADVEDAYPLAMLQQGMLYHIALQPEDAPYHNVDSWLLAAPFAAAPFRVAVQEVVRRHPALRTSFHLTTYSQPLQLVHREAELPVAVEDLRQLPPDEQRRQVAAFMAGAKRRPLDFTVAPQLRFHIHLLDAETFRFTLVENHAVFDGWSLHATLSEIFTRYFGLLRGAPLPVAPPLALTYRDFVHLERSTLSWPAAREHWRRQLDGHALTELPRWPEAPGEPAAPGPRHRVVDVAVPAAVADGLRRLAQAAAVPIKSVLLAAHLRVMGLVSGRRDVTTGVVFNGRPEEPEGDDVRGLFLNSLPLRVALPGGSWEELVRAAFGAELEILPYRRFPLTVLQREAGGLPLFEALFNYIHFHVVESLLASGRVEVREFQGFEGTNYPLHVSATPFVQVTLEYDATRLPRAEVEWIGGCYARALAAMSRAPQERYDAPWHLSEEERQELLAAAPAPVTAGAAASGTLVARFEERAAAAPDAVAALCACTMITLGELNRSANRLSHHLRRRGVRPEMPVVLCLERSLDLVIAALATLKAGGACVPIDEEAPGARTAALAAAVGAGAVVAMQRPGAPGDGLAVPLVVLAEEGDAIARESAGNPLPAALPDNLAHLAVTAGPGPGPAAGGRRVLVTHAQLLQRLAATAGGDGDEVRALAHAGSSALWEWELWGALLGGGRLVVVPSAVRAGMAELDELLVRERVTVLAATPAELALILRREAEAAAPRTTLRAAGALRRVELAGEPVAPAIVARWLALPGGASPPRLLDLYGSAETGVGAAATALDEADAAAGPWGGALGSARPHLRLDVLDPYGWGWPAPPGVPGEVCASGAGLARGYLGDPGATALAFLPDPRARTPAAAGSRLHPTGDLARRGAAGRGELLGRRRRRVVVRGAAVAPEEVEAALAAHPEVAQAAVTAQSEGEGASALVAYVAALPGTAPTAEVLRAHLAARLAEPALPARIVVLPALPLAEDGRLDRAASTRLATAQEPPRTPEEEVLAEIWAEVLERERVALHDDFFALGGDSIASLRVAALATARGLPISPQEIFRRPTVAALAAGLAAGAAVTAGDLLTELPMGDRARLPEDVEDAYPLTLGQAAIVYDAALAPFDPPDLEVASMHLRLRFVIEPLRAAAARLAARHPLLRTSFDLGASEPLQRVHRAAALPIEVEDGRGLTAAEQDRRIAAVVAAERCRPFDLAVAPQLRLHVLVLGEETIQLTLAHSAAILDGVSRHAMLGELFALYFALLRGEEPGGAAPPAAAWREVVAQERRMLATASTEAFWSALLADAPFTALAAWPDGPFAEAAPRVRRLRLPLPRDLAADLAALSRRAAVPPSTLLLAAHVKALAMAVAEAEVVTGLATDGRPEAAGGLFLGPFANVVPLRLALPPGSWFDLVAAVERARRELLPHRRFPRAAMQRRQRHQALFEVAVDPALAPRELARPGQLATLAGEWTAAASAKLVVAFAQGIGGAPPGCEIAYDARQLPLRQVEAFGRLLVAALAAMIADAAAPHSALPLLTAAERQQLLVEWNDQPGEPSGECRTATEVVRRPRQATGGAAADTASRAALPAAAGRVHELCEWQAARRPEAPAVAGQGTVLPYGELDRRAERLARRLRQLGVGPEVRVAICVARTPAMVVALIAILKAGGTYVPLDPSHPPERLAWVLRDSAPAVVVTEERWLGLLAEAAPRVLCLDRPGDWEAAPGQAPPQVAVPPESLAYIIYTSGSTGRPKGVGVSHRAVVNFLCAMAERLAVGPRDVVAALTTLTFDIAGLEIYLPLAVGGRIEVLDRDEGADGRRLGERLAAAGVTLMQATPATWRLLVESEWAGRPGLTGLAGGEALPRELAAALLARGVALWNVYGPTETAIWSTAGPVARADGALIDLGRPIANTRLYVVDRELELAPSGAPGELLIGGAGVARGYWRRPELTAERFVPDAWSAEPGARLYRTGDLVRRRWDGALEFLGRIDHQVKIRGFRIEPGEIEEALARHPAVRQAVVVARRDAGDTRLVAYVVPAPGQAAGADELRRHLMSKLPLYMVPAAVVELAALPTTPSGKLDRRALPPPGIGIRQREVAPPRTPLELQLVHLWEETLAVRPIGIDDDFFELGGNSMLAVRLAAQLRQQGAPNLPLSTLVISRTVRDLALLLSREGGAPRRHLVAIQPRGGKPPIFWMHPGHGNVVCYLDMARHLGPDQPTYGLQALDLDENVNAFAEIEELAARYVAEIRAHQPQGPYLIGGWSLGGVIAYEVAQQLTRGGGEVTGLFLLDCSLPVIASSLSAISPSLLRSYLLIDHVRDAAAAAGKEPPPLTPYDIDGMDMDAQLDLLVDELARRDAMPPGVDRQILRYYFAVRLARIAAQNRYVPRPYPGRITLIRTTALNEGITLREMRKMYRDAMLNHPTYGWETLTPHPVEVRYVPGHHESMMREPHVRVLAAELRAAIAAIGAIADHPRTAATAARAAAAVTTGGPTP